MQENQDVKALNTAYKKPTKENPNQAIKRLQAKSIDELRLTAHYQNEVNQYVNKSLSTNKTLIDVLISKASEGEIIESSLTKEELQNLNKKYLIEQGALGTYAIDIDTLQIFKYISCLEGWKMVTKEPIETAELVGELEYTYTFENPRIPENPDMVILVAKTDQEASYLLRNQILGL